MGAEEWATETLEDSAGLTDTAVGSGPDDEGNERTGAVAGTEGEGGEDCRQRIGGVAVKRVVELGVAADREDIRGETQVGRTGEEIVGGSKGMVGETAERACWVVGGKLGSDGRGKLRRDAAEETDGAAGTGEEEVEGAAVGIRLMNGGEGLLHVLRAAIVVRWNGKAEEHGRRIAKDSAGARSWEKSSRKPLQSRSFGAVKGQVL